MQLFPYHLADYACRVLRVTPFRYYIDLLFTVMREEKSYDQIPNFTVRPASYIAPAARPPRASDVKSPGRCWQRTAKLRTSRMRQVRGQAHKCCIRNSSTAAHGYRCVPDLKLSLCTSDSKMTLHIVVVRVV